MDQLSCFSDKAAIPTGKDLPDKLGDTYALWQQIHAIVLSKYPEGIADWNFPGKKYGWSYRIKDKKRALIYFLPREGYFKVAFVFGDRALNDIMNSDISETIKTNLKQAPKYVEGTGIRINISDSTCIRDIEQLLDFKLKY